MNSLPPVFVRYLSNASWLLSERVYRSGIALLLWVLLARYLGPLQFGELTYVISLVALLGFLNELGMDTVLVKELVDHPEQHNDIKGTAFILKSLGTTLLCLILIPVCFVLDHSAEINLYVTFLAAALFFQSFAVIDYDFQARVESRYVAVSLVVQVTAGAILKIICILTGAPLLWIVLIQAAESAFLAAALIWFHRQRRGSLAVWRFDSAIAKRLLRACWPLMLSSAAILVYMRIDQVMIKTMLGTEEVGLYGIAVRLSEAVYFIPGIVAGSLFPAIVAARQSANYLSRLQNLYDLLVWMAVAIAIPVTLLAPFLVLLLFGPDFAGASTVLMVHIWAAVFVFFALARGKWIVNEGLQRYALVFTVVGAAANIGLNMVLIPRFGINGAALATLCSVALVTVIAPAVFRATRVSVTMFLSTLNVPRAISECLRYLR